MNRLTKLWVLLALGLSFAMPLIAAEAEVEIQSEGSPQRKLQRGFLNIVLSPFEISNELSKEFRNNTFPPSWVAGLGRGSFYAVGRALVGVYEIVSFPLAYPNCYAPVLQPEFAWQHLPDEKN